MRQHALTLFIVGILISLVSCSSGAEQSTVSETQAETTEQSVFKLNTSQFVSSGMKLGKLEMNSFHEVVSANGHFDVPPENRATISTYFGGTVKNIQLLPGELVKNKQVLFSLENPDYVQLQQDYLETKGQLSFLKSDFERQKNLAQDNVTSQKKYLKAESDFTVMKVKLESLSKKLVLMGIQPDGLTADNIRTSITITSPITGYITEVNITRGSFLSPSETAITIVDTDHLHLELNIFEKDLHKVSIGQPILFSLQEDEEETYKASVYLVNKTVDVENRTIGIHGHLSDEKLVNKFNPGMYVEANIITRSESRIALPQDAVVEVEGKYYVLVLIDSTNEGYSFVKREVQTGLSDRDYIEIRNTQDFKENEEIVIKGAFNIL